MDARHRSCLPTTTPQHRHAMQLTLEQANIIQQGNYTNINDVAADALQLLTQRWYNHTRGKDQLEEIKEKK
jgi:hypothetical protein